MNKTQDLSIGDFEKRLQPQKPLIGIDYGNVRIGIAISDTRRVLASAHGIISKIAELDDIVAKRDVGGFVVGLPLQPDGNEGKTASQVRLFIARLNEKFGLPVLLIDERDSSAEATDMLRNDLNLSGKQIKQKLDAVVAANLLQSVLNLLEKK